MEEILLMAYIENKQAENGEIWYIDYGKNLICDLNEFFFDTMSSLSMALK